MKIHELNCLLGKISCTLNSVKSEISSESLNSDVDFLIDEINSFQNNLPSNEDVDRDIDTMLFILEDELGRLVDESISEITILKNPEAIPSNEDEPTQAHDNKNSEHQFNSPSPILETEVLETTLPTSQSDNTGKSFSELSGDLSFTCQGVFGAKKPCISSLNKVEILISQKYLWSAINSRLTSMSYRKIPYESVRLGLFSEFLGRFYSVDKTILELIDLFVDMGEYSKSDDNILFKGDSIKLNIFSGSSDICSNPQLLEKRYNHKTSFKSILDEVSLLSESDDKLNAILGF